MSIAKFTNIVYIFSKQKGAVRARLSVSLRDISRRETDRLERARQKEFDDFIVRQIKFAHEEMEQEMKFQKKH